MQIRKLSLTMASHEVTNSLVTLAPGRLSIVPSLMFVHLVVSEELKHPDIDKIKNITSKSVAYYLLVSISC